MAEAADAPQGGALSLDEAVALLDRREDARGQSAELGGDAWDEDFEGAASAPEETAEWAEDPLDGEDETEAEELGGVDRLAPPTYWSKDAKARFAELDPDLQAVVLSQEGPREAAAARAKAEAEHVRTAAVQEAAQARHLLEQLADALPEALQSFSARWQGTPDWAEIAAVHGVEAMQAAREEHAAERARLERASQVAAVARRANHQAYVAAEFERLKALDPELAHPETGTERRTEITRYLHARGIPPEALVQISALEMSLARKAMLWDQAQAKARASNTTPRPDRPATRSLARGGASAGPTDPKVRRAAQAASRFAKSRSIEDAVALLNVQGD
jgi:hypothetical protein